jgi:hypothetical protein
MVLAPGETGLDGAPRGIVAVATASTFGAKLVAHHVDGAAKILPVTFPSSSSPRARNEACRRRMIRAGIRSWLASTLRAHRRQQEQTKPKQDLIGAQRLHCTYVPAVPDASVGRAARAPADVAR